MTLDEKLAQIEAKSKRNQVVADKILARLKGKGIRLMVGVSAEGIHFFDHVEFSPDGAIFVSPSEQAMAELARLGIGPKVLA